MREKRSKLANMDTQKKTKKLPEPSHRFNTVTPRSRCSIMLLKKTNLDWTGPRAFGGCAAGRHAPRPTGAMSGTASDIDCQHQSASDENGYQVENITPREGGKVRAVELRTLSRAGRGPAPTPNLPQPPAGVSPVRPSLSAPALTKSDRHWCCFS